MKKNIRAIFSLFICGILLLTGCASSKSSLPKELVGQKIDSPDTLNILAPYFFSSPDEETETLKQQWIDKMSARFGIKLNITSDVYKDGKRTNDAMNQVYNVLYGKSSFAGLLYTGSYDLLAKAIQNGTAVPLEDYLADNPAWKALPEDLKSAFMVDGHLYAIPTTCNWTMYARSIYTDTLEKTGIQVTDLNSLRDYALALKKTGDYEFILGSTGMDNLGDILNAYGLYTDSYSGLPFSYDPGEDCYVDFLTKGDAVTALEYLRDLYTAGALKLYSSKGTSPFKDFTDGTCPTYYDQSQVNEKYTEVYTLNPAYPQLLSSYMTGFIMTKDTPQPKETINCFVNMLFGSEQNYLECSLGLANSYILNSDGSITLKLNVSEDGSVNNLPTPGLVGTLPGAFPHSDRNFKLEVNGTLTPELAASIDQSNQYLDFIKNAFKQGSAVKAPLSYLQMHTTKIYDKKSDITFLYVNCIKDAITATNWTVEDILKQYKLDMLGLGGNALLDEMNAAIGKKTAYYYN